MAGNSRPLSPSHLSLLSFLLFPSPLVIFISSFNPRTKLAARDVFPRRQICAHETSQDFRLFFVPLNFRSRVSVICSRNKPLTTQSIPGKISIDIISELNLRFLYLQNDGILLILRRAFYFWIAFKNEIQ